MIELLCSQGKLLFPLSAMMWVFDVQSIDTYQRQEKPIRSEAVKRRGLRDLSEQTKCELKRLHTLRNKWAHAEGKIPRH